MRRGESANRAKWEMIVVNIYEAGPFEGRVEQWPVLAVSGALEVRLAETELEIEQAQRLRYSVFYEEMSAIPSPQMRESGRDFDKFDDVCDHLLVVDRDAHDEDGQPLVVGTYRLTRERDAAKVGGFSTSTNSTYRQCCGLCRPKPNIWNWAVPAFSKATAPAPVPCSFCGKA